MKLNGISQRAVALVALIFVPLVISGCGQNSESSDSATNISSPITPGLSPAVQQASDSFANQKSFDPWVVGTNDPNRAIDPYLPEPGMGYIVGSGAGITTTFLAGKYQSGVIAQTASHNGKQLGTNGATSYSQTLNFQTGQLATTVSIGNISSAVAVGSTPSAGTWQQFWKRSDIVINGDPEAQQVTHANMFYLAGSASPNHSVAPMGQSSQQYLGHIFWDAEIWMLPALVVQHPDLARGIIDYRFKHLAQAEALAKSHGYKGAEFPWESADTGMEEAPSEFSGERHITADIAFAAWNYYLWTGDKQFLRDEGWPILRDNAEYWASRAKKESDGHYQILNVIGPDETSDVISDDAWTNAIVSVTLRDAETAASDLGLSSDPKWTEVRTKLLIPKDPTASHYVEFPDATDRLSAKQADTQMLIYPLRLNMTSDCAGKTLDYAIAHTETHGPAMTDSINAIDAALLGRSQQSLDLFHDSYRPFMRGPWDAFSEKRSTNGVYFCTGMGGCLQTVLYGFAGLQLVEHGQTGQGTKITQGTDCSLYVCPHLPPGWTELKLLGVHFQGKSYNIDIQPNSLNVSS